MKKALIAATAALLLSGCLDLDQSIVINADGTASYQMEMRLSSAMISVLVMENSSNGEDGDFNAESICDGNDLVQRDVPDDMEVSVESRFEEASLICSYKVSGPLERFGEIDVQGGKDGQSGDLVTIVPMADSRVEITSTLDFSTLKEGDSGEESLDDMAKTMLSAMVAGHSMRWSVTAPEILESNGTISEDRKSVTWDLPLTVAVVEKDVYEFRVVASYDVPWYQGVLEWVKFW